MPADVIPIGQHVSRNLDELIERREKLLAEYQDEAYAARYRSLVDRVRKTEQERAGSSALAEAVARYYAKLLAYKDEYEVARLHADPQFVQRIRDQFEGDYHLVFHLAPPLLARPDPRTGAPQKIEFGPWMLTAMRWLAKLKGLRGTAFDPFGRTAERRSERALIAEYEQTVEKLLSALTRDNVALAVEIASLPEQIRGYGHVKAKNIAVASKKRDELFAQWSNAATPPAARAA
jgi:indolepyruvate ferredoxin oxidoreductase